MKNTKTAIYIGGNPQKPNLNLDLNYGMTGIASESSYNDENICYYFKPHGVNKKYPMFLIDLKFV